MVVSKGLAWAVVIVGSVFTLTMINVALNTGYVFVPLAAALIAFLTSSTVWDYTEDRLHKRFIETYPTIPVSLRSVLEAAERDAQTNLAELCRLSYPREPSPLVAIFVEAEVALKAHRRYLAELREVFGNNSDVETTFSAPVVLSLHGLLKTCEAKVGMIERMGWKGAVAFGFSGTSPQTQRSRRTLSSVKDARSFKRARLFSSKFRIQQSPSYER